MKTAKPIKLLLPFSLICELDKYLESKSFKPPMKTMNFYIVIADINNVTHSRKDSEFVPLNTKYLKSVIGTKTDSYIKTLSNGGFIISDEKAIPGKKSYHYKLNSYYGGEISEIEIPPDNKLFRKILKHQRKKSAHINRLSPHIQQMRKEFLKMELDYPRAIEWANNQDNYAKRVSYLNSINLIQDKRLRRFSRNKTNNRLDTNLTNLKSDLRQFIIGDYVSIDLKNSQPFFLSILLESIIYNKGSLCWYLSNHNLSKTFGIKGLRAVQKIHQNSKNSNLVDLMEFKNAVISGIFYDHFKGSFSEEVSRDKVKDIMFKVLFSKNNDYSKFKRFVPYKSDKERFKATYPTVYNITHQLKEKSNSVLPILLQKIESYIFIDCISKELVRNNIIPLTIHDSVIIKRENVRATRAIIEKVFQYQFGEIPSFHIKDMTNDY